MDETPDASASAGSRGGSRKEPVVPPPDSARRGSAAAAALLTYGTNFAVALLSLANVLIVSRVLGPGARGEVAFLITVTTMSAQVGGLSQQEANANIGGSEPRMRARLATNTIAVGAACGIAAAAVVLGLVAVFPDLGGPVSRGLFLAALAAIPIVIVRTSLSYLLQAEYAFRVTNLAWLLGPLLGAGANGILALLGWISVTTAFVTWVAGQAIGLLLMIGYAARHSGFGAIDLHLARRALGFGLKTHPGRLMGFGNYRADQWFVGSMAGSRELGFYSVAVAWAELLYYLPGVLTLVQRPDLVRATREDAARLAARLFRIAILLAGAAALALIVLAPLLCEIVFGSRFAASVDDLRVLALAALGITAIDLLTNALTAQRMPVRSMVGIGVSFAITIALDIALIPRFGGVGAATASAVAYTVGGAAAAVIFARTLGLPLGQLVPRAGELRSFARKLRSLRDAT